jgi:site-specific DNA-cytosine methylase
MDYPESGQVNHIHASSPCQGFSRANREKDGGKNGEANNKLVYEFVRAVEILRPDTVSFENVEGILDPRHIGYLQDVVAKMLIELEYNVRVSVLNAADYGDAQNRRRVFLFASKADIILPDEPINTHGPGGIVLPLRTVRDCIGKLEQIEPQPGEGRIMIDGVNYMNHSINGTKIESAENQKLEADKPASTLYGNSTYNMVHYLHDRSLTILELALLQSFPIHHIFSTNRNTARRQIQNVSRRIEL